MSELMHIARLAAMRGLCSRREAAELLRRGKIWVNGRQAVVGDKAAADARIHLETEAATAQSRLCSVALHKPVGYLSQSSDPLPHQRFALDLLQWANQQLPQLSTQPAANAGPPPARLPKMACAGRLDEASSGLLVFTQRGALARAIIRPDGSVEKEYRVRVRPPHAPLSVGRSSRVAQDLASMRELDAGEPIRACEVEWSEAGTVLSMVLRQGRKRQIRRMLGKLGLEALELHRIRIGNLRLDAIPAAAGAPKGATAAPTVALQPGKWTFFNANSLLDAKF